MAVDQELPVPQHESAGVAGQADAAGDVLQLSLAGVEGGAVLFVPVECEPRARGRQLRLRTGRGEQQRGDGIERLKMLHCGFPYVQYK